MALIFVCRVVKSRIILRVGVKGLSTFQLVTFLEDFIDDWVLVRTPYPVAIVLTTYLLVVFKVGPYFMRHRKPLELQNTMRIYNVFQMLINAYQFYSVSSDSLFFNLLLHEVLFKKLIAIEIVSIYLRVFHFTHRRAKSISNHSRFLLHANCVPIWTSGYNIANRAVSQSNEKLFNIVKCSRS